MSLVGQLVGPVAGLLDKFIEDKDQKNALAHEIATMSEKHGQQIALQQIEVLKADAKGNWFQSSWRPLAGYTCVLGLMVNFLIAPICAGFGIEIPQADAGVMMPLLLGMLGLSGGRSYERVKGVSK
ncbi:Protein of unknown function (DUF3154) [uncultured Mediterranean phage uvMED]|nr:Protein of unknown function (DUF3154) [uncultured Mediterranean phage uvMED]BAQ90019.1 Protein of unknown function (DUF3154) [uncultured Mediterranean phage uvMED]BAQ90068.1 Protein of unknown function (DUF3154) [uncultured Mediterranean phage uvMED]